MAMSKNTRGFSMRNSLMPQHDKEYDLVIFEALDCLRHRNPLGVHWNSIYRFCEGRGATKSATWRRHLLARLRILLEAKKLVGDGVLRFALSPDAIRIIDRTKEDEDSGDVGIYEKAVRRINLWFKRKKNHDEDEAAGSPTGTKRRKRQRTNRFSDFERRQILVLQHELEAVRTERDKYSRELRAEDRAFKRSTLGPNYTLEELQQIVFRRRQSKRKDRESTDVIADENVTWVHDDTFMPRPDEQSVSETVETVEEDLMWFDAQESFGGEWDTTNISLNQSVNENSREILVDTNFIAETNEFEDKIAKLEEAVSAAAHRETKRQERMDAIYKSLEWLRTMDTPNRVYFVSVAESMLAALQEQADAKELAENMMSTVRECSGSEEKKIQQLSVSKEEEIKVLKEKAKGLEDELEREQMNYKAQLAEMEVQRAKENDEKERDQEGKINDMRKEFETKISELECEILSKHEEITELRNAMKLESEKMADDLLDMQNQNERLQITLKDLENQINQEVTRGADEKAKWTLQQQEMESNMEYILLSNKNEISKLENDHMKSISELETERTHWKDLCNEFEQGITKLKSELDIVREKAEQSEKSAQTQKSELHQMQGQINHQEKMLQMSNKQLTKSRSALETVRDLFQDRQQQEQELLADIDQVLLSNLTDILQILGAGDVALTPLSNPKRGQYSQQVPQDNLTIET